MRIENFSIKNKAEAEDEEDDGIGNGGGVKMSFLWMKWKGSFK